jgi:metal-responsive CopG/Arc/MetJ family transcriptional regulator
MNSEKQRVTVTLDKYILEEMDRIRNERTRSNYINDLLFYSLATEEDLGTRKFSEK